MQADEIKGKVDFAIITIREDEFLAVLDRFPSLDDVVGRRTYSLARLPLTDGDEYVIVTARSVEQGVGAAQDLARDLIEDFDPQWLMLVGVAGGVPSDDYSLGDVVAATRLSDFSVTAAIEGGTSEYALSGGPMHKRVQDLLAHLPARLPRLAGWNSPESVRAKRPRVAVIPDNLYGNEAWTRRVRQSLEHRFAAEPPDEAPRVTTGPIASSDRLVKDTGLLETWRRSARHIAAVEMELAGVYHAARRHDREYPVLAIRGISDVVGFKRDADWTQYACHTAAAFAHALLASRPIASGTRSGPDSGRDGESQTQNSESQPAVLSESKLLNSSLIRAAPTVRIRAVSSDARSRGAKEPILAAHDLVGRALGPVKPEVVFAGFFQKDTSGTVLTRSSHTALLESRFADAFHESLRNHSIRATLPLRLRVLDAPESHTSRSEYVNFEKAMNAYAAQALASIWGIADASGRVVEFHIATDPRLYPARDGKRRLADWLDHVTEGAALSGAKTAEFLGAVAAAIWGSCVCQLLTFCGHWKVALIAAIDSKVEFETALARIGTGGAPHRNELQARLRRALLPVFLLEEARAQAFSDTPFESLRILHQALLLNPTWPFESRDEFARFYSNRYALDTVDHWTFTKKYKSRVRQELAGKAYLDDEPLLHLFLDWIYLNASRIENLEEVIDHWFSTLAAEHASEPFVFVYWTDAVKIPYRARTDRADTSDQEAPTDEGSTLPLPVLRAAMEKCERALSLAPQYSVIGTKLCGMEVGVYTEQARSSSEPPPELSPSYLQLTKRFFQEYFPNSQGGDLHPALTHALTLRAGGDDSAVESGSARRPNRKSRRRRRDR